MFDSSDVYDQFRDSIRRLAEDKVKPHAAKVDREKRIPVEAHSAFRAAGLLGLPYPEEWGGQDGEVPSGMRLEFSGAFSGNMKVSFQAARSIG